MAWEGSCVFKLDRVGLQATAASLYSNSSSVPAITSDAKLTGYVTTSAFNQTEQSRVT